MRIVGRDEEDCLNYEVVWLGLGVGFIVDLF